MALGAFLGGLAQGGVNTYKMLEDIESQKKRDQLLELQAQEARDALEEKRAIKGLNASTYGQVGAPETAIPGRQMTPEEVTNAHLIDQGDPSAIPVKTYTKEQADADYIRRLKGINYEKGVAAEAAGLQLKGAYRTEARAQAEDDFAAWMQNSVKQIEKDPVQFVRDHLNEYNKPKPGGHLDDKLTGDVVAGADGKTFSFVQKDAKGKVVASTPITPETAMQGLQQIAFSRFQALPGKFKEGMELGIKGREVDVKQQEADTHRGFYGPGGTYERVHNAQTNAMAGARNQGTPMGLNKDGTKMLFSTPSGLVERPVPAGYNNLFPKVTGEKKGALGQPVTLMKNEDGTVTAYSKDGGNPLYNMHNGEKLPLGMDIQTYQGMKKAAQSNGVKLVAGEDDNGQFALRFQGADGKFYEDPEKARYAKVEPAAGGIKTGTTDQPEKRYIRSKSPRGGYIYTESPRGQTMSAYRESDAKKSALPQ